MPQTQQAPTRDVSDWRGEYAYRSVARQVALKPCDGPPDQRSRSARTLRNLSILVPKRPEGSFAGSPVDRRPDSKDCE
jgi:hypothetical protein